MITDDTVRLVCVYMLLLGEFFSLSIWPKPAKSDVTHHKSLAQLSTFMHILKESKIMFINIKTEMKINF